jgi:DNA protecting protein DprA
VPFEGNRSSAPESDTGGGAADSADGTAHGPSDEPDLLAALSIIDHEVAGDGSSLAHDSSKHGVRLPTSRELLARAAAEEKRARAMGIAILTLEDDAYPALLREIPDPPPVLYARGALDPDDEVRVAIVGSRRASRYGISVAELLGHNIALAGITVVSGLARGIDAAAHRGALAAPGRTIAVLGSGLDALYPREHGALASEIAARGAVISEYPLDAAPMPHQFPRRNRVISGLSAAVVVVEAARQSGALVTARLALEQNRELSAVPGSILSETSIGTNDLLREGVAHFVTGADDVLAALPPVFRARLDLPASPLDETDAPHAGRGLSREEELTGPCTDGTDRSTITAEEPIGVDGSGDPDCPGAIEDSAHGTEKSCSIVSPRSARDRSQDVAGRPQGATSRTRTARPRHGLTPGSDEFLVAARLSAGEETSLDELLALCGLPVSRLLAALSALEMRGLAVSLPGNRVTLSRASAFDKPGHSPYR